MFNYEKYIHLLERYSELKKIIAEKEEPEENDSWNWKFDWFFFLVFLLGFFF